MRHGSIRAEDLKLFLMTDSQDEVFDYVGVGVKQIVAKGVEFARS